MNLLTGDCRERKISFRKEELQEQEAGFCEFSEGSLYVAFEGVFHSLLDFLEERIRGNVFDRGCAMQSFRKIAANPDGTCGEKTFDFIKRKVLG